MIRYANPWTNFPSIIRWFKHEQLFSRYISPLPSILRFQAKLSVSDIFLSVSKHIPSVWNSVNHD